MIELRTAPEAILIDTRKPRDDIQLGLPDEIFTALIVVVVQSVEGCRGDLKLAHAY